MKKYLKLLAVLLAVVMLSSCSLFIHPVDNLKIKVAAGGSFQLDIKLTDIPLIGDINILFRKDGDKTYTSGILGTEVYTEKIDEDTYVYTKNLLGKWGREKGEKGGLAKYFDEDDLETLLISDNYEKSETDENTYILKSDVSIKNLKNVEITFGEDTYKFHFTYDYNGIETDGEMTMSKIGDVSVELPTLS